MRTYKDCDGNIKQIDLDFFIKKSFVNSVEEFDDYLQTLVHRSLRLSEIEQIIYKK